MSLRDVHRELARSKLCLPLRPGCWCFELALLLWRGVFITACMLMEIKTDGAELLALLFASTLVMLIFVACSWPYRGHSEKSESEIFGLTQADKLQGQALVFVLILFCYFRLQSPESGSTSGDLATRSASERAMTTIVALAAAFGPAVTAVVLLQRYPEMTAVEEDNLCTSRPDAKPPTMVVDNPMNRASARLSSYRDSRRSSRRTDVEEALSAPTVSLSFSASRSRLTQCWTVYDAVRHEVRDSEDHPRQRTHRHHRPLTASTERIPYT